jgi:hypothetical protein
VSDGVIYRFKGLNLESGLAIPQACILQKGTPLCTMPLPCSNIWIPGGSRSR